jgi:putative transcriptional regulator
MIRVTQHAELDESTRAALASGRAEPALDLFLDVLMQMRGIPETEGEIIAGVGLEVEAPAEMSADALAMAFAAIERGGAPAKRDMAYPELAVLPARLREAIIAAESRTGWKTIGLGIRSLDLGAPGALKAEIIRLAPGKTVPRHTHKGRELTLCIHGEYLDSGAVYGPGDFTIRDLSVHHEPKALDTAPAYALAVTDAGLRFDGLLGVFQKLFGL